MAKKKATKKSKKKGGEHMMPRGDMMKGAKHPMTKGKQK